MRPAGAVLGGSGEVPGSSREALGDCGRLQESPEGSREAPGGSGEAPGAENGDPREGEAIGVAWTARILGPPNIEKLNTEKPSTEH